LNEEVNVACYIHFSLHLWMGEASIEVEKLDRLWQTISVVGGGL
jgi:hypothetical protein